MNYIAAFASSLPKSFIKSGAVMNWKCGISLAGLFVCAAVLLSLSSCAHDQELVSMSIKPATATFLSPDPNAQIVFTAFGSYIHPPETKDLTATVTWKSDVPQLITVSGGVVSPTGLGCGVANLSASLTRGSGANPNVTIAYATVTVNDSTNPDCPGNGASNVLTVTLMGTGSGSVSSTPAGISCPAQTCGALFLTGTTVRLTATANSGSTFAGWGTGCSSTSGNVCTVILSTDTNVNVTFN